MEEQNILSATRARALIREPRFGLGDPWHVPALSQALSCSAPFECMPYLGNAMRAFMNARVATGKIDRFLNLWTALNALREHIAARFEAAQALHLHVEVGKLPSRYRIHMIDSATIGSLAVLIDPVHSYPNVGALRSPAFRDAQRALGGLAQGVLDECKRDPRGALVHLTKEPRVPAFCEQPRTCDAAASTATEELFALAEELGVSPLVFVMLVASYELRNGLVHGSVAQPLLSGERFDRLDALDLCSFVLDAFLDCAIPRVAQQIDAGDGRAPSFPEPYRQAIAQYLDHRFDGLGIVGILQKYGLFW